MILQCPGCHKRLSMDDRNDGKMVKCPACTQQFRAGAPATRIPQAAGGAVAPKPRPAPPAPDEDPGFDVVDDDNDAANEAPPEEAPARPKKATSETLKNAISPTKTTKRTVKDPVSEDRGDEPPQGWGEKEELRPKKAKKKKKKRDPEPAGAWIPYAIGVACLLLVIGGIALAAILADETDLVITIAIWLAIAIPVSTVILVVSMVLSSAIGGGIEFGEIHVVVPKAMGLLIVVNLVNLIPMMGWFLVIPVWWGGLMFLFGLDFWECRFLIFINWFLNTLVGWAIFAVLFSAS